MGCYVWGLGRCFGFGHGGFGLARGGFGLEWCGFWGYDFEGLRVGQGRTGWVCWLVRGVLGLGGLFWVRGFGFAGSGVVLGVGGSVLGSRGIVLGLGVMVLGDVVLGFGVGQIGSAGW